MVRFHILAQGRVQGVGFRFFCQMNATSLGLTGWVKNLYNGDVEMEVQGDLDKINKFIDLVKEGNRFIRVDNLNVKEIDIKDKEKKFTAKY
ncbi:acylphosphatase [Clostridium isatidis]|uniref:acylphosphatase n=1 Tax=Clostridium isatidis TaxID=182773 RepID=A0A343JDM8_9CLOT|nr:acylphosphatase [Clostridium isatidis]ASW43636.1 acylphosphatase [Clostridium isatidis]NLZ34340.1 acylphosphatase [Clostridiales bacterium]